MSKKNLSLAMRLKQACAAVPAMDKLGSNPDFNYVKASQIFEVFRAELLSRDILLLPDDKELTEKDVPTPAGPVLNRVSLLVEYELRDCSKAAEPSIIKKGYGSGIDFGDKALYKAKTGALKYFFRVLGIIPWIEADDPEYNAVGIDAALNDPRVYKSGKKNRADDRQIRAFNSAVSTSGKTAEQVALYLRERYDLARIEDMAQPDFIEAIRWACGTGELTEALEVSLAVEEKKRGKKTNGKAQPVAEVIDKTPADEIAGD